MAMGNLYVFPCRRDHVQGLTSVENSFVRRDRILVTDKWQWRGGRCR